ncbi:MAG: acyloxyacyl hydrolase [Acidobacteriales bacterium]|nr:acyloxyacyl hydrolase [Terriglobales bacterium]
MKKIVAVFLVVLASIPLCAQERDEPLQKGTNVLGVFMAGGNGVGKRSTTHFAYGGFRYGRVLTAYHGKGWIRGNFEFRLEIIPLEYIFQPPRNAFGAEFRPVNFIWNFKGSKRVKPYTAIGGGLLLTNHDVPVATNGVNFTPQGGVGFHFMQGEHRAITAEFKYLHVSNAGLTNANSGINASFHVTIGYTWFK